VGAKRIIHSFVPARCAVIKLLLGTFASVPDVESISARARLCRPTAYLMVTAGDRPMAAGSFVEAQLHTSDSRPLGSMTTRA
jgi:hypothetical protein